MTRKRSTPYTAQLDRLLSNESGLSTFSAATLEARFEHPPHQKRRTNIAGIHNALMKAFAEGRIVTFVDEDGRVLREPEIGVPGSKAVSQPQIFARPATASPDSDYHPVAYEQTVRGESSSNGVESAAAENIEADDGVAAPVDEGDNIPGGDDVGSETDRDGDELTTEKVVELLEAFPPKGACAPEVIDDRVLRVWVSLPEVCKSLSYGFSVAEGLDKFELIRAGITRKQNSWRSESTIAGNLAALCRTSPILWLNVANAAIDNYIRGPFGKKLVAELPELIREPLDYYEKSELPPDAIVLFAIALGIDEAEFELMAADSVRELGERTASDKTTAQQERIQTMEAEAKELRRTAKDAEREARAAKKREQKLNDQLTSLREAQKQSGQGEKESRGRAEQELTRRAEKAEAQVEKLEAERIPELEAELEALEDSRSRLEAAEAELRSERRLRTEAEQDAARHNARVRAMTDELSKASDSRNLPTDDAASLLDALTQPIGQAARHAAERLAAARSRPHDEMLLELAAGLTQMNRRVDADIEAQPATAAEPSESPVEAPEGAPEATAVEAESLAPPPPDTLPAEPATLRASAPEPSPEPEAQPVAAAASEQPVTSAEGPAPSRRLRRRSRLKVRPLGGAGEVGASAILVTNNSGHTVLLDCGQRVRGEYGLDTEPQFHRSIGQDGRLHAILLSHAHIDHVGSLPILHRSQSEAQDEAIPVYMTEPTRRLSKIMLEDSAKIQQHRETQPAEVGFLDYGVGSMEAAYRLRDVNDVLDDEVVREVTPALAVPIPETSFVARFIPVAHVLGSCAIHLTDTENDQTLLYTGDLGPFTAPQATLPQYALADMLSAHLVVMESTYGSQRPDFNDGRRSRRSLSPREAAVKRLCQLAEHAHDSGGVVLLPAFSLGRTQELAMLIEHAKRDGQAPPGEIIVGGMGEKITQVYSDFSKGTNAWARAEDMPRVDELGGRLRKDPTLEFDDIVGDVLEAGFAYIIASPAMLGSGWSRTFLRNMVSNPVHTVVMSGYVPRHSGNIPHLHRLHKGETINLDGQSRRIMCEFDQLKGLSAHAPNVDLNKFAQYMARQGDSVAFAMVHGDEPAQRALAEDVSALPGVASADALHNGQVWQPTRP
jgi:Cft2 family RNA processing exonuclease